MDCDIDLIADLNAQDGRGVGYAGANSRSSAAWPGDTDSAGLCGRG